MGLDKAVTDILVEVRSDANDINVSLDDAITVFEELCKRTDPSLIRERLRTGIASGLNNMGMFWDSDVSTLSSP